MFYQLLIKNSSIIFFGDDKYMNIWFLCMYSVSKSTFVYNFNTIKENWIILLNDHL